MLNLLANAIDAEPEPLPQRNTINAKQKPSRLLNATYAEPEPPQLRDDKQCSLATRHHCRDVNRRSSCS